MEIHLLLLLGFNLKFLLHNFRDRFFLKSLILLCVCVHRLTRVWVHTCIGVFLHFQVRVWRLEIALRQMWFLRTAHLELEAGSLTGSWHLLRRGWLASELTMSKIRKKQPQGEKTDLGSQCEGPCLWLIARRHLAACHGGESMW